MTSDIFNFDEIRAVHSLAQKVSEELSLTPVSNAFCHSLKRAEMLLVLKSLNLTLTLVAVGDIADVPNEDNSE